MHRMRGALASLLLLIPGFALAQAPPGVARGEVAALDHDNLVLKVADGTIKTIALAKDWTVTVLKPVDIDAIQPGSFIGTAEMPQKNGTGRSLEVHVFPPGVKPGRDTMLGPARRRDDDQRHGRQSDFPPERS